MRTTGCVNSSGFSWRSRSASNERAGGRQRRARLDPGQRGGERELSAITEDRRRTQEPVASPGRRARRVEIAIRDCLWTELEHVRRLLCGRRDPLPPDCVEQRDQEERVAARSCLSAAANAAVGLDRQVVRAQARQPTPAQTAGPDHHAGGIGEQFRDERGKLACSGGRVPRSSRSGSPSSRRAR